MAGLVGTRERVLMLCGLNLISCRVPLIESRCGRDVGASSRTWVSKSSSRGWLGIRISWWHKTCLEGHLGCVKKSF